MFVKSITFFNRSAENPIPADGGNISPELTNANNGVGLQIQVDGNDVNIAIQCRLQNNPDQEWHQVGAIALRDYTVHETIDVKGEYQISMDGIEYCRIVDLGSGSDLAVYGNLIA